jgi:hypothetical protein
MGNENQKPAEERLFVYCNEHALADARLPDSARVMSIEILEDTFVQRGPESLYGLAEILKNA